MSRRASDYVLEEIYGKHLYGKDSKRYLNSPVDTRTQILERFYTRKLTEACIARFKWTGLPPSVNELFLEQTLFYNSLAVFYNDPRFGEYLALKATSAGRTNVTDDPTRFRVYGSNFSSISIPAKFCVPIWGHITRTPDIDAVMIYARRFAELDRSIEINSKNARRTKIIEVDPDDQLTMANIQRAIDNGDPYVTVRKQANGLSKAEQINALDLGIDLKNVTELQRLKEMQWNECMMYLGVDSTEQSNERKIVAEVEADGEQTNLTKSVALKTRKIAAEQINRKYRLNVRVEYDTDGEPGEPGDMMKGLVSI